MKVKDLQKVFQVLQVHSLNSNSLYLICFGKRAIPVRKRIKEIEDLKREFIETIQDPKEILELIPKIILNAYEEILILFSNLFVFEIFEIEIRITQLLRAQLKNGFHLAKKIQKESSGSSFDKDTKDMVQKSKEMIINGSHPHIVANLIVKIVIQKSLKLNILLVRMLKRSLI
jgi:sugar-specific transcriptional regulator TrmB